MALTDRAGMSSATTGTGTLTLGSALGAVPILAATFDSFVNSGCIDGQTYSYLILDTPNWEYGRGTYTASGTTLSRGPIRSSSGTSAISLSGNQQVFVSLLKEDIRELLLANRTYYVSTGGSGSNNGLSAGSPLATLNQARDKILQLDLNGFTVTVQHAAAQSPTSGMTWTSPPVGGNVIVDLGGSTLNVTNGNCFFNSAPFNLTYQNGTFQTTTSGSIARAESRGTITQGASVTLGASTFHLIAFSGGQVVITASYTINGGAVISLYAEGAGSTIYTNVSGATCTVSGTPAFSGRFASGNTAGVLRTPASDITFSGAATGTRYYADVNGVIAVGGGGANFYPGNAAGSTATGGQYA